MRTNILLTGLPKSGKSTLLNTIISEYSLRTGFVTKAIIEKGERTGFEILTSEGHRSTLASTNFRTDFQVSKYFVNIDNLDAIIAKAKHFKPEDLLFVDEIGQMQLKSDNFKQFAQRYLESTNVCIATISKIYDDEFTRQVKERPDIILVELYAENRKEDFVRQLVKKIYKAQRYVTDSSRFSIKKSHVEIKTDHGLRHLTFEDRWNCECNFFKQYELCSHQIALEEHLKQN